MTRIPFGFRSDSVRIPCRYTDTRQLHATPRQESRSQPNPNRYVANATIGDDSESVS